MVGVLYLIAIAGLVTLLLVGAVVCQTHSEARAANQSAAQAALAASGNSHSLDHLHIRLDTHTATRIPRSHLQLIVNEETTDGMGGEDAEWSVPRRLPRHRRHQAARDG